MILEVCVDSYESLLIAKKAGADRIELCSALNIGGLTPSYGLMNQASQHKDIEIFVMIRPRSGDFLYSALEFETMKEDIDMVKKLGFNGIVIGMLLENGDIDIIRMKEIVEYSKPLHVVLHRAFDEAKNPELQMNDLIDIGICRILTSGQKNSAVEGLDYIKNLQEKYGDKITIMPGAGINYNNIENLCKTTKCNNYHLSGKIDVGTQMNYLKRKNSFINIKEYSVEKADYEKIRNVRMILNQHIASNK